MMESCLMLNQTLINYTHEARELMEHIQLQKYRRHLHGINGKEVKCTHTFVPIRSLTYIKDRQFDFQQTCEASEDLFEKLKKLLATIDATGNYLFEFTTRAKTSYDKLEEDINISTTELADAKSQITRLSNTTTNWGNSTPSKISLRRTNESRLQCIRSLQKELAMQRRKNATLERSLEQAISRVDANACAHNVEVEHLRATVSREVARNQRQAREVERFKRNERLAKRNGVRKATINGPRSHEKTISDLSKQLEGLVLAAARQRRGVKTERIETPEPKTVITDGTENLSNFDMMMRIAVELQEQSGSQLPEINFLDNSFNFDTILDECFAPKSESSPEFVDIKPTV